MGVGGILGVDIQRPLFLWSGETHKKDSAGYTQTFGIISAGVVLGCKLFWVLFCRFIAEVLKIVYISPFPAGYYFEGIACS